MFGFERIIIPLIIFFIGLSVFYIILRRWKIKKKEEQIKRLKEDFDSSGDESVEVEDRGEKVLKNVTSQVKKAFEGGKKVARLSVEEDIAINVETPDVISLKLPECTLYKSFESVRFEKVEKKDGEFELHFIR